MAIKGKAKSRGGRRPVATGPKPAYVPVKRPLVRRRGFWVALAVVVVAASVAGIWYGVAKQRSRHREEALAGRLRIAATKYQGEVDPILAGVGQSIPPSGFSVLPTLPTALDDLRKANGKPSDVGAVTTAAGQAKTAAGALDKIDVLTIVRDKGFDQAFVLYVIGSQARMVDGLKLYEQAANLIAQAATLGGDQQARLLDSASGVLDLAKTTFDDGYSDYVQAQAAAGTFQPTGIVPGSGGLGTGS